MESLTQVSKRVRSGLKASFAEIEGLAFGVRVIGGTLCIEVKQVRTGFKVLTSSGSLTSEAMAFRDSLESFAMLHGAGRVHARYSDAIIAAEQARIAGGL